MLLQKKGGAGDTGSAKKGLSSTDKALGSIPSTPQKKRQKWV